MAKYQFIKISGIYWLPVLILMLFAACKNHREASAKVSAQNGSIADTTKTNTATTTDPVADSSQKATPKTDDSSKNPMEAMMKAVEKNSKGDTALSAALNKAQAMLGGKKGNPGDAISKMILKAQMGQMKDGNPLKSVARNMMKAQSDGTAGPSKDYTAIYKAEQPSNYTVPVSGNGNGLVLQYTGGTIENGQKNGLWKNVSLNSSNATGWNIYTEAYMESAALKMKVHNVSLANKNKAYSIILNDQYQKYAEQPYSDIGKNESDVSVVNIGNEKIYNYDCVHIKISYTLKALGQSAHFNEDDWYSTEVPGAALLSPQVFENHSPAVLKKIQDTKADGVLVKSISRSGSTSELIQLTAINHPNLPDKLFVLPANYQEDKNPALYSIQ